MFAAPADGKVAWMGSEGGDFSKDPIEPPEPITIEKYQEMRDRILAREEEATE